MKKLYCIVMYEYDEICGSREAESLHTTNKKRLEDLCIKLNKKVRNTEYSFHVKEIIPKEHLSRKDINDGIKEFARYGGRVVVLFWTPRTTLLQCE